MKTPTFIIAGFCLLLIGCGYQPLYGTSRSGNNVNATLSKISVSRQTTRTGQLVRNEIISLIGKKQLPKYKLSFDIKEKDLNTTKSFDSDVLRHSYQLKVKFALVENSSQKIVFTGTTFAHVSYDNSAAAFSNYQARISAQQRAAKQVGGDIHTRVAAYFARK